MPLNCHPAINARTDTLRSFPIAFPGPNGNVKTWLIVSHFDGPLKFGYIATIEWILIRIDDRLLPCERRQQLRPEEKRFSIRACSELNWELPSFARILML